MSDEDVISRAYGALAHATGLGKRMELFMDAHCAEFARGRGTEFGHGHFHVFSLYRREFEAQARSALESSGVSLDKLERALAAAPAQREAVLFASLLASAHSFVVFADMMRRRARRRGGGGDGSPR